MCSLPSTNSVVTHLVNESFALSRDVASEGRAFLSAKVVTKVEGDKRAAGLDRKRLGCDGTADEKGVSFLNSGHEWVG